VDDGGGAATAVSTFRGDVGVGFERGSATTEVNEILAEESITAASVNGGKS